MAPPIHDLTVPDGVRIAYTTFGSGAGVPVVALRPSLLSHVELEWQLSPQLRLIWGAEQLARTRRIVRVDARGCGLSGCSRTCRSSPRASARRSSSRQKRCWRSVYVKPLRLRATHGLFESEVWVAEATAAPAIRRGWPRELRGSHTSADGTLTSPSWWTTLADGSLPHNHHKPQLAGYELGGAQ